MEVIDHLDELERLINQQHKDELELIRLVGLLQAENERLKEDNKTLAAEIVRLNVKKGV